MPRSAKGSDISSKRFEINQLFTPSAPVTTAELFAGRSRQLVRIVDSIAEPGRHVILYGERGVGKTSLAQIVPYIVPRQRARIRNYRVQAFPTDTFNSLARKIFQKIKFRSENNGGGKDGTIADLYEGEITPDDFISEFSQFNDNDVPIVVVDEFNEVHQDGNTSLLFANTIRGQRHTNHRWRCRQR